MPQPQREALLVSAREDHLLRRFRASQHTFARSTRLLKRNAANRRPNLILDALLVGAAAGPVGARKAALDLLLQLIVGRNIGGALLA